MNRGRIVLALLLVAATAGVVLLAVRSGGGGGGPNPGSVVSGATHLPASGVLFGDQVPVRISVLVDRRRVDPSRIAFHARFDPYEIAGAPRVSVRDAGRLARVVYSAHVVCFKQDCVPDFGSTVHVQFPPAQVSFVPRAGGPTRTLRWNWGPLTIAPRTSNADFYGFDPFKMPPSHATLDPGAPSYSVSPHALRVLLFVASGLLAVAALAALARFVLEGRVFRRPLLSPLERALVLVERATARTDHGERRKALALLSEELARTGEHGLSSTARELAWSEPAPAPVATEPLTVDVRRVIEQRSNGHAR